MSWIPNLALHRKLAARVRTSADGFGRADCADEFRKTVDAFKLILTRDGEDVGVLAWDVPLSQDGEELALPGVPSSVQLLDADIDSGTWTARIESLDGTYVAYTDSVGKSSADVVIADDIDVEHGISISGGLAMDDDLSTGGEPDPGDLNPGDGIYQLGDSTTFGHNSIDGNQVATPAPMAMEAELGNVYPVTFEGVGLATTSDLIAGTGGFSNSLANLLAASPAKVVIYPWGINDSYLISDSQFEENLRTIVATTRSAGKIPILQTPNPTTQNLSPELAIIRSVASELGVPLIDVHAYLTQQLGGAPVTTMMPDGIHPSQETYLVIGEYQASRIRDIFSIPGEAFFFFKPESPWNADIPNNATYHGSSHPVTAEIRKTTISGGSTLYAVNAQNYAINVYYASSGGPTKTVRIKDYWGRWDFNVTVPWPSGTHPAMGTDGHLSIHDPDGITTHEFWYLRDVGGGQMEASTYARVRKDGTGWNLFPEMEPGMIAPYSRNPAEATAGSGACRAVSVGLLGGLITKEDVDSGEINHALAMALPRAMLSRGPRVYPADATPSNYDGDSSSVGPIKYSMRFALPKSLNLDSLGLSSQWLMVARAFQNKGGYPVDVGGNGGREIMIYTQYPGAYSFGMALRERQSTDFRAIVQRLEYVEWY